MTIRLLTLFFLWFWDQTQAQQPIFLVNPSFEDHPGYGHAPGGWRSCAFDNESPPDVHPVEGGNFQVYQVPADGETYLGLVVRQAGTTESVGQELSTPLEAGRCYALSVMLCCSEQLVSAMRSGKGSANFDQPATLRIWGGISPCGQKSLLAESPPVAHLQWMKYTFRFQPEDSLSWISLEAWYDPAKPLPYNGNLLLDGASPILPIDCETLEPLVDPDTVSIPAYQFQKVETAGYKAHYFQTKEGFYASMSLRKVKNPEDLDNLLLLDCAGIGFVTGKRDFVDGQFNPLKEVAYNVSRFSRYRLVAGLNDMGEKLTKKRIKSLRLVFREVGLKKDQYRIVVDDSVGTSAEWRCNQELWLKVEKTGE